MNVAMAVDPIVLKAWGIWLIVATAVTLIDVVLLVRVIRAANRIASLTARTLPSAKNIAIHTAAVANLSETVKHGAGILTVAGGIAQATSGIGEKLGNLHRSLGGR